MYMTVEAEGQRRIDGIIKTPISGSLPSESHSPLCEGRAYGGANSTLRGVRGTLMGSNE